MSRIGRLPVAVPSGVEVAIDGQQVTVTGPKGTLRHVVAEPISVHRGDDGALEALQEAGLIRVESRAGKVPMVTILDVPAYVSPGTK